MNLFGVGLCLELTVIYTFLARDASNCSSYLRMSGYPSRKICTMILSMLIDKMPQIDTYILLLYKMLMNITFKKKGCGICFVHFSASKGNKGACKYDISRFFRILDPP